MGRAGAGRDKSAGPTAFESEIALDRNALDSDQSAQLINIAHFKWPACGGAPAARRALWDGASAPGEGVVRSADRRWPLAVGRLARHALLAGDHFGRAAPPQTPPRRQTRAAAAAEDTIKRRRLVLRAAQSAAGGQILAAELAPSRSIAASELEPDAIRWRASATHRPEQRRARSYHWSGCRRAAGRAAVQFGRGQASRRPQINRALPIRQSGPTLAARLGEMIILAKRWSRRAVGLICCQAERRATGAQDV